MPKRIQRTRKHKQPPNTKYCGRPTKWGNPFRLTTDGYIECFSINRKILDPWILWSMTGGFELNDICDLYKIWLIEDLQKRYQFLPKPPSIENLDQLKEYDFLSCWCPLDKPCHVDILIELISK